MAHYFSFACMKTIIIAVCQFKEKSSYKIVHIRINLKKCNQCQLLVACEVIQTIVNNRKRKYIQKIYMI